MSAAVNLDYIAEACSVYCEGPLLKAAQLSNIFNESKYFVDMPMKRDPADIMQDFLALPQPVNSTALLQFIDENFYEPGADLLAWDLPDFQDSPAFIKKIPHVPYQSLASDLNYLWKDLGRIVNNTWFDSNPSRHSYLPRPYGMVVPGGRFRESYYWDSYFTILGLLVCDMPQTAKSVIDNLLGDVENFGFVPNGGRIYYQDRSQPPFLSDMVSVYFDYMMNSDPNMTPTSRSQTYQFLNSSYFLLDKEYNWWMNENNGHVVNVSSSDSGKYYILNRYFSNYTTPRPESYYEDYYNGYFNGNFSYNSNISTPILNENPHFFHNIRGGAESGWDFSSRWVDANSANTENVNDFAFNLTKIDTSAIVPVDLNTFLHRFENNMVKMANTLAKEFGVSDIDYLQYATMYKERAALRKEAINSVMWDADNKKWKDLNHTSGAFSNVNTIANFAPLWAGIFPESVADRDQIVASMEVSNLLKPGGILTTTSITNQQWDAPNAWPPLVYMAIQGLTFLGTSKSLALSANLSSLWLNTNYLAYESNGFMYEKYNAFEVGVGGGGGEYEPQMGFGWTNGVSLSLLNMTISSSTSPSSSSSSNSDSFWSSAGGIVVTIIIVLASIGILFGAFKFYKSDKKFFRSGKDAETSSLLKADLLDYDVISSDNSVEKKAGSSNGSNWSGNAGIVTDLPINQI